MPNFQPDTCTFKDGAGYGDFDIGHGREHLQFVQVAAQATPALLLPDYDLLSLLTAGSARQSQLATHYNAHLLLRQATGVQGVDLTQFNLDDENDFYNFIGYHQTEHQQLRAAFGITY